MLLRIEMGFCGTTKQRVGRESSAIVERRVTVWKRSGVPTAQVHKALSQRSEEV